MIMMIIIIIISFFMTGDWPIRQEYGEIFGFLSNKCFTTLRRKNFSEYTKISKKEKWKGRGLRQYLMKKKHKNHCLYKKPGFFHY